MEGEIRERDMEGERRERDSDREEVEEEKHGDLEPSSPPAAAGDTSSMASLDLRFSLSLSFSLHCPIALMAVCVCCEWLV